MKLEPNQTLDNRYEVIEKIGEGEIGVAWKATDNRLNDEVVIKVPQSTSKPALLKQFRSNALSMRRLALECINILDISDVGSVGDCPYYVVRHVAGGNLRNRQSEHNNSSQSEWKREQFEWLSQIASALDYLHKNEVVHRSVKPENILFNRSGLSYLADFGITASSEQTQTHTAPSKAAANWTYAPPEHLSGEPFVPQSDQYSLAVSLYEAVLGEAPFSGATPFAVVRSIMKGHRSISDAIPTFPTQASVAIDRAMSIESADRFDNCKQFADAFLVGLDSSPQVGGGASTGGSGPTGGRGSAGDGASAGGDTGTPENVSDDDHEADEEEIVAEVDEPEDRSKARGRKNVPPIKPGDSIGGRYKITESVSFGTEKVFQALDLEHQRQVVIKTASHSREYLHAEIEGLRSLAGCPGVPKMVDAGEQNGNTYLVLEYLPGGTLREWQVQYDTDRGFHSSFRWLTDIAQTLDQAHRTNGVVHNDVRPDNILFDTEGEAFLISWTQASFRYREQKLMADPEQDSESVAPSEYTPVFEDRNNARFDQYSLAVTLYEFLAGSCPHKGDTEFELYKSQETGHDPLYTKISGFPLSASNVVDRGLNSDADQRFESCGQFAAAFMDALKKDSALFESNFPIAPYKPRKIAKPAIVPDAPPQTSPPELQNDPGQAPIEEPVLTPKAILQKQKSSREKRRKEEPKRPKTQQLSNQDSFPVLNGYGAKLDGRYVLLEKYPDAGFLWKARDLEDDCFVTIRFWQLDASNRDAIKQRNDAIRWISIVHPVLQLKSVGEVGGYFWSVTDLPEGGFLEDRVLSRNGHDRFSADLGWVSKIAKTVDQLDQHTDSPAQLLIETYSIAFDASGSPCLCNLVAKSAPPPDWSTTLTWHGSDLRFRGPENSYKNFGELIERGISDGSVFEYQSQTFAVTVALLKKLTGKYPSDFGLTQFSWNESDLDACLANLTPHMRAVFRKALAFDPRDRYANCKEFASALTIANQSLLELAPRPIHWHCIECGEEPNSYDDSRCNQCGWRREYPHIDIEPESYCSTCGAASNHGNFCEWCGLSLYEHNQREH